MLKNKNKHDAPDSSAMLASLNQEMFINMPGFKNREIMTEQMSADERPCAMRMMRMRIVEIASQLDSNASTGSCGGRIEKTGNDASSHGLSLFGRFLLHATVAECVRASHGTGLVHGFSRAARVAPDAWYVAIIHV